MDFSSLLISLIPLKKKNNKNKGLDRGAMRGAMFFIAPLTTTLRP
jgi:hypothetical protein